MTSAGVAAIGHVDADCFYVSAERVRDAFLVGKPVGVLGNQGACVIARSYEMKKYGVKVGQPIWEAKEICRDGVYLKRDFRWYEVLSKKMLDVVRSLSPQVEYYSIDEFFFRVESKTQHQVFAESLRKAIFESVGVPATVGIARTRTLAKLISDSAKPFGALAVLDPSGERELLARLPITEVSGIADRRAKRLSPYGVKTCLDFARMDRQVVKRELTIVGEGLWYELNGEPITPINSTRPHHKMLGRGGSIGQATADPNRIFAWAVRSLERLIEELEFHQVRAGKLRVAVQFKDGDEQAVDVKLPSPTKRFEQLLAAARDGLRRLWMPGKLVHYLHLNATDLRWPGFYQQSLFDQPAEQADAIACLKHKVNAECGRFAVRSGATLYLPELYRDEAHSFEICDIREKMCF